MDKLSPDDAIISLVGLRNKWNAYTAPMSEGEREQHSAHGQELDAALQLWLLDAYFTAHDFFRRNQITARITKRKFPEGMDREEIALAVVRPLLKTLWHVAATSNGLLHLQEPRLRQILATAEEYFDHPNASFTALSPEESERLLRRLTTLLAEEDLFVM